MARVSSRECLSKRRVWLCAFVMLHLPRTLCLSCGQVIYMTVNMDNYGCLFAYQFLCACTFLYLRVVCVLCSIKLEPVFRTCKILPRNPVFWVLLKNVQIWQHLAREERLLSPLSPSHTPFVGPGPHHPKLHPWTQRLRALCPWSSSWPALLLALWKTKGT